MPIPINSGQVVIIVDKSPVHSLRSTDFVELLNR